MFILLLPGKIIFNCMPLRCIESDSPWRMNSVGSQRNDMVKKFRFFNCPFQKLLSSHGTTSAHENSFNSQMLSQQLIGSYHVPNCEKGKIMKELFTGFAVVIKWSNTPITTARHINAHYEVLGGIEQTSFANEPGPPFQRITICCECMKDPYHIVLCLIQRSMQGVSKMNALKCAARLKRKRFCMFK
jgi:hypothetical protein